MIIFAATTQRTVGVVIAALAIGGFLLYLLFNWFQGRAETGSELELAPNRKEYLDDDVLETKKLDLSLGAGLVTLALVAVALPLYWLGEPGRQEGAVDFGDDQAVSRGTAIFEENCAQCHGTVDGPGGVVDYVLLDDNGIFLEQVEWKAPGLGAVLYRFSEQEVRYVLDYGRPNTPMPAWGAPGGGVLTTQQVDEVLAYLQSEQIEPDDLSERVVEGLPGAAFDQVLKDNEALLTEWIEVQESEDQAAIDALRSQIESEAAALLVAAEDDPELMGELLFINPADSGSYSCARCHTAGWSYDADAVSVTNPLIPPTTPGGGGFAPNLTNGDSVRQFTTPEAQISFVIDGSQNGVPYGNSGQGDGGGQMPGFGACHGDRDAGERDRIARASFCEDRNGTLTLEQIEAIVAYERGL
jgi:mono/diheme cytochrome c family protein